MFLFPMSDVLCIQPVSVMTHNRPVGKKKKKHGLISLKFPSAANVSHVSRPPVLDRCAASVLQRQRAALSRCEQQKRHGVLLPLNGTMKLLLFFPGLHKT